MIEKSKALKSIQIARAHLHNGALMTSSAVCCFNDACDQYMAGEYNAALMWAFKSLSYSIGIFHPDYARAYELRRAA